MKRRDALHTLGAMAAGVSLSRVSSLLEQQADTAPSLLPGAPSSAERLAIIESFKTKSEGLQNKFEARSHKSDWVMPYRLFKPEARGKLPLVVFLHGSGGLGTDNAKQMETGNIFGTRVWAMPEHQQKFPCYVLAPQTDRGWMKYGDPAPGDSVARVIAGLGDGVRVAHEIIESLKKEFPIDEQRIYVTGQSMGGGGAWHMTARYPRTFAAAAICCGSASVESAVASGATPVWNFQGDADTTVPPTVSRERIATMRKAGLHPLSTEYAGVGHNVWQWAYTEPALLNWIFSKRRT